MWLFIVEQMREKDQNMRNKQQVIELLMNGSWIWWRVAGFDLFE